MTQATTASTDATDLVEQAKQQERVRIQSIVTHDEGLARQGLAQHLAFSTDMHVDAAIAALGSAPQTSTTPSVTETSSFQAHMNQLRNPEIVPSSDSQEKDDDVETLAKSIANS